MSSSDYFGLFGIEKNFAIDESALEHNYYLLQAKYHPDKYSHMDEATQNAALQNSITINSGYQKLKDPLARAEYILELNNISVNQHDSPIKPSQEILLDSLHQRQYLEELTLPEDGINFKSKTAKTIEVEISHIQKFFDEKKLNEAALATIKLRYLTKLLSEIDAKIDQLKNKAL